MTRALDKALADVAGPKFTCGPWKVAISGRGSLCVASDDAWICGEIDNQPHELLTNEARANAHLIAAAPDMYGALELFIEQWNACGPNSDFGRHFRNIRDAALRATGAARGEQS